MTDLLTVEPRLQAQAAAELFIEFDRRQLTVTTDVPEMHEFLAHEYSAMLVAMESDSIGRLEFVRSGDGYAVRGLRDQDYSESLSYLFESMKGEIVVQFIRARQDLMWLHAGAIEYAGKAILFPGPAGNGKSTLVTTLCDRGWRFLSDDIAPVSMVADTVFPFPQTPHRRIYPGRQFPPEEIGLVRKEAVQIDFEGVQRGATTIGAIVFPVFQEGIAATLTLVPAGDAALKLIRDCTNFVDHKAAAVARAVEMARTIPVYELSYSSGAAAASLCESLR